MNISPSGMTGQQKRLKWGLHQFVIYTCLLCGSQHKCHVSSKVWLLMYGKMTISKMDQGLIVSFQRISSGSMCCWDYLPGLDSCAFCRAAKLAALAKDGRHTPDSLSPHVCLCGMWLQPFGLRLGSCLYSRCPSCPTNPSHSLTPTYL